MSVEGLCGVFIPGWVVAGKWQSQADKSAVAEHSFNQNHTIRLQ